MKTVVYICDICGKEARTESEVSGLFGSKNPNKGSVNGSLLFNNKKVNISINISMDQVEHVCKKCQSDIMESFLKKEVVETYFPKNKEL